MESAAIVFPSLHLVEDTDEKYKEMTAYLSSEDGYWLNNDIWKMQDSAFIKAEIKVPKQKAPKKNGRTIADFTEYPSRRLKIEAKYHLLHSLKEKYITVVGVNHNYTWAIHNLWRYLPMDTGSFSTLDVQRFEEHLPQRLGIRRLPQASQERAG